MQRAISQGQRWLSSSTQIADFSVAQIACLREVRRVIRLSGTPLVHFLQGLITADASSLEAPDTSKAIYSCILNAQGRYLHDLFLFRTSDIVPTVLLDADATGADDLLRLMKRYRLRQKIDIDDVSRDFQSWVRFSGTDDNDSCGSNCGTAWVRDPRLPSLGRRTVLPTGAMPQSEIVQVPWQSYRRHRFATGVAEGDSEIPSGEAIALEYNIDGLNGISFTKGCYVGQELMARTHFKGVIRKRIMPFEVVGGAGKAGVQAGEAVFDQGELSNGKSIGTVRVEDGGAGLAHVRLSNALAAAKAGRKLRTEGGAELRVWRPEWWPTEWGGV